MSSLQDKNIVITGGCGLLGRYFAESCANNGACVTIADLNSAVGESITEEIIQSSGNEQVYFERCDITDTYNIQKLVVAYKTTHQRVDALVNNAYPRNEHYGRSFEDVTYDDFCENVSMHLGGYFNITREIAKVMMNQNSGNIINVASIYGVSAPRFEIYDDTTMTMPVEYAAIKGGVIMLTKYLASYLGRYNIRVNAISPGGIENNQPASFIKKYTDHVLLGGRMAQPEDIVGVLSFLLSDQSKYITGQNIVVDGGWTL